MRISDWSSDVCSSDLIKLGRGGIREIEFFAQTQQLIWGGRLPDLRTRRIPDTLRSLAENGQVEAEPAREMAAAYAFLRRLEHRLKMTDGKQTQALPNENAQIVLASGFMGSYDGGGFPQTHDRTRL